MIEWNDIDEAAAREGQAIKKSFRSRQPRRPRGVDPKDEKAMKDVLRKLKLVGGKQVCH